MSIYPTALQSETIIHRADDTPAGAMVRAERTDAQLVGLILAGDETAFEHLFERHKRVVGSIAARFFRKPEQIEEIVQIAFAKAYSEFRSSEASSTCHLLAGWDELHRTPALISSGIKRDGPKI